MLANGTRNCSATSIGRGPPSRIREQANENNNRSGLSRNAKGCGPPHARSEGANDEPGEAPFFEPDKPAGSIEPRRNCMAPRLHGTRYFDLGIPWTAKNRSGIRRPRVPNTSRCPSSSCCGLTPAGSGRRRTPRFRTGDKRMLAARRREPNRFAKPHRSNS